MPAAQYEAALAPVVLASEEERKLSILAAGDWRDTGVSMRPGETYEIVAEGKWQAGPQYNPTDASGFGIRGLGEIIAEMAAIDDEPHMASAVALEDTTVTAMSRSEVLRRLKAIDPIMRGTILAIVRRAREMGEFLMENGETIN